jgi:hypothetical protein
MATPVYLAYGIQNLIVRSADAGATWAPVHQDVGSPDCVLDIAWDGASTMVAVGGETANVFLVSHDSGATWAPINTSGRNVRFGFGGFDVYPNSGQIITYDPALGKFIAVGADTGANLPVVCTSPDGDTWTFQTVAGQTGGRFLCIAKGTGGIYVVVCWFGGIGGSTASQIFSSTDLAAWTSRFTTGGIGDRQYPWIKWNGTDFLILNIAGNGNSIYSSDGLTFHETADSVSPNLSPFYGIDKAAIWDTVTDKWIVSSLGPLSANGGIFTATNPPTAFATAYVNPHTLNAYAGSVVRAGNKLVAFMGGAAAGVSPVDPHLESTDAITWTPTGPALDSQYFAVLWDGTQFVGIRIDAAGNNDNFIAKSPDASTWTNVFDDTTGSILNIALFAESAPGPKPPSGDLIGFTFNEEQGVTAWHRHPLVGGVKAIACIPNPSKSQDDLWLIVNRVINGVTKQYVEYMAPHFVTGDDLATDAFYSDSGVTVVNSPPSITVTGLGHLEGEMVKILTDGALHPDGTVIGGSLTLQWKAAIVQIGLPQLARLTTMPIEAGATTGSAAGKVKRITDVTIRLQNTLGGQIGREDPDKELSDPPQTVMEKMEFRDPDDPMSQALTVYNGLWPEETYAQNFPGGSEVEGRITMLNDEPYPMTVVGIYPNLDSED